MGTGHSTPRFRAAGIHVEACRWRAGEGLVINLKDDVLSPGLRLRADLDVIGFRKGRAWHAYRSAVQPGGASRRISNEAAEV